MRLASSLSERQTTGDALSADANEERVDEADGKTAIAGVKNSGTDERDKSTIEQ